MSKLVQHLALENALNLYTYYPSPFGEMKRICYSSLRRLVVLRPDRISITDTSVVFEKAGQVVREFDVTSLNELARSSYADTYRAMLQYDPVLAQHLTVIEDYEDRLVCQILWELKTGSG